MKFHQLPIGARFQYDGERYIKTTPMVAHNEKSKAQRFIVRSALVQPLNDHESPPQPPKGKQTLQADNVEAAFNDYHRQTMMLLKGWRDQPLDEKSLEKIEQQLAIAKDEWLKSFSIKP